MRAGEQGPRIALVHAEPASEVEHPHRVGARSNLRQYQGELHQALIGDGPLMVQQARFRRCRSA